MEKLPGLEGTGDVLMVKIHCVRGRKKVRAGVARDMESTGEGQTVRYRSEQ